MKLTTNTTDPEKIKGEVTRSLLLDFEIMGSHLELRIYVLCFFPELRVFLHPFLHVLAPPFRPPNSPLDLWPKLIHNSRRGPTSPRLVFSTVENLPHARLSISFLIVHKSLNHVQYRASEDGEYLFFEVTKQHMILGS